MNFSSNSRRSRRRDGTRSGPEGVTVSAPRKKNGIRRFVFRCLGLLLLVVLGWSAWVVHEINVVAGEDQTRPSDAIAVFGAAEYAGRPSPVYHARLDHALALYVRQIAPLIITFGGGADKDSGKTEGGVGRDYLLANGVPFDRIVAETHSIDTEEQVAQLAQIAQERGLQHIVVVSDDTHLFRVREMCRNAGLDVYTSPRPALGHINSYDLSMRYFHEIVGYTAMRLGVGEDWFHYWVDGKD